MTLENRRSRITIFIIIAAIAGVAGISGFAAFSPENEQIVIATNRSFGSLPVWVAYEEGIFEKYGLDVTLREFSTQLLTKQALDEGQAHFVGATPTSVFEHAASSGQFLKLIHVTGSTQPGNTQLIVRDGVDVSSLEDLKGKVVAFDLPRSGCQECFGFEIIIVENGLSLDHDISIKEISYSRMSESLEQGLVDAAIMTEPYSSIAVHANVGYVLLDPRLGDEGDASVEVFGSQIQDGDNEVKTRLATFGIWTSEEYLTENPETVHKVSRSLAEASTWLSEEDNRDRAVAILVKYLGILGPEELLDFSARSALETFFWKPYPDGFTDWEALEQQTDRLAENGIINSEIKVDRYVSLPWHQPNRDTL